MIQCKSYIGNEWASANEPEVKNIFNPADLDEKVCEVEYADVNLANDSIKQAKSAFNEWKEITVSKRAELLEKFLNEIKINEDNLAEIITRENGKTLKESYDEINSGLNEAYYQINFLSESLVERVNSSEIRYEPMGIVLLITPWNFPLATVLRKMIPALMVGNTVILKPSELTPLASVTIFKLMDKINLPNGVVNLVLGDGSVGKILTSDSEISAISLTGSTFTGKLIKRQIADLDIRFQAEMGGKNCVAVLPDAQIEKAALDIVNSSYACCGQWCTGTSKVVVHSKVYKDLLDKIFSLTKEIKLGNGLEQNTGMGPLISEAQLNKVENAVHNSQDAKLVIGGKKPSKKKLNNGYFFEPTIFSEVPPNSLLAQEEIFGPVLSILIADDNEELLKIVNDSNYGLSSSVYTTDRSEAERFVDNVHSGLCHINLPTPYRDPALPLLGWKNSGFGLPESGRFARDFFSKTKAVYRNL